MLELESSVLTDCFPPDNSDDVDPSAAASKDGQPAAPESGRSNTLMLALFVQTLTHLYLECSQRSQRFLEISDLSSSKHDATDCKIFLRGRPYETNGL